MEIRTDCHDKANSHLLQFFKRTEHKLFILYLIKTVQHEEIRGNKHIALRIE